MNRISLMIRRIRTWRLGAMVALCLVAAGAPSAAHALVFSSGCLALSESGIDPTSSLGTIDRAQITGLGGVNITCATDEMSTSVELAGATASAQARALANGGVGGYAIFSAEASAALPASAGGRASASWLDEIMIVSPALPTGALVQLSATFELHGSADSRIPFAPTPCDTVHPYGADARFTIGLASGSLLARDELLYDMRCGLFQTDHSVIFEAHVGDTLRAQATIVVEAGGTSLAGGGINDGFASFQNTALYRIDVLTPGVSYVTGSGLTYFTSSSIPEPGTLFLLATGVIGLVAVRRPTRAARSLG